MGIDVKHHVGTRAAFEERHVKKGTIRARGNVAFAVAYSGGLSEDWDDWLREQRAPECRVERFCAGHWLATNECRGASVQQAINFCAQDPSTYRVVVKVLGGRFVPVVRKGPGFKS